MSIAKDLRDCILDFMQQHPIGKNFTVKHGNLSKVIEQYDEYGQAYESFDFEYVINEISYHFHLGITHFNKDWHESFDQDPMFDPSFKLSVSGAKWNIAPYYFSTEQLAQLKQQDSIQINSVEIKESFLNLSLSQNYLIYYHQHEFRKSLSTFNMCDDELHLTKTFLKHLDQFLNFFCSVKNIEDLAELIFSNTEIFTPQLQEMLHHYDGENFKRDAALEIYRIILFSGKYPEIEKRFRHIFTDYPKYNEEGKALTLAILNRYLAQYQALTPLREQRLIHMVTQ